MNKKKRTVITEESHEVWIIRQGERQRDDSREAEPTDDASSPVLINTDGTVARLESFKYEDDDDPPPTTEVEEQ